MATSHEHEAEVLEDLGISALDHTAIAVRDLSQALRLYRDLLNGTPCEYIELPEHGFCSLELQYPHGNKLELLAPLGDERGFVQEFLEKRGEGVHHITFLVHDIHQSVERASAAGLRVVDEDYEDPDWKEAFIAPRSANGTVIQLAETRLDHHGREEKWPAHKFLRSESSEA